ncbi:hypothetical protein PLESTB_001454600 [Pleodorina starrii]|uniref:Thioesterase domain-containing protein n=1 Tax=Pleodorina starrii TaxID=330485 RepID=A0A9W6F7B2_9CHLO|nr:hypothetical protein PLESTM_000770900 [Pleodorina starrii]GLC59157.1 hypothetical protein PLESTB_001454600 [Pleodorina starrii]GLC65008.1 hypothetical protein PLESTF_000235600 [Pleodorina starrii]
MHSKSNTLSALARGASSMPLLRCTPASQGKVLCHNAAPAFDSIRHLHSQRFPAPLGPVLSAAAPGGGIGAASAAAVACRARADAAAVRNRVTASSAAGKTAAVALALSPAEAGTAAASRAVAVAAAAAAVSEPAPDLSSDLARLFPGGEYSVEMRVRDYELDQFNVVNNAVYSSFFQHGRHEAFEALGHNVDDYARRGTPLALSQLNITFRAPLRSRDVFRVTVAVQRVTGARVVFHQRILKPRRRQQRRPLAAAAPPPPRPEVASGAPDVAASAAAAAAAEGRLTPKAEEPEEEEEEELIAEAEAVVVFLDSQYRPARMPRDAAGLLQALADLRKP